MHKGFQRISARMLASGMSRVYRNCIVFMSVVLCVVLGDFWTEF